MWSSRRRAERQVWRDRTRIEVIFLKYIQKRGTRSERGTRTQTKHARLPELGKAGRQLDDDDDDDNADGEQREVEVQWRLAQCGMVG